MQQIPIDASFLNSCFHTFLDSHFYKPVHASLLPVTYETIDSSFIRPVGHKKQLKTSKYSSYTGFIAAFYSASQLEIFGYLKDGTLDAFINLEQAIEKGHSDYFIEYSGELIPFWRKYINGKSIEPPFIWGHDNIITEKDFIEWVRQEIHYVIDSGLYHQEKSNSIRLQGKSISISPVFLSDSSTNRIRQRHIWHSFPRPAIATRHQQPNPYR